MKKWKLFALLLSVSMVFTGCFKSEADENKEEAYKTVKVNEVKMRITDQTLRYSGVVKSKVETKVSFKTSGRVERILVQEGERVEPGQVLAMLDTTDTQLQVQSLGSQFNASQKNIAIAKEAYDYQSSEYNKAKSLHEAGIISNSAFDASSLVYEQAKLSYEMALDSNKQLGAEKGRLEELLSEGTLISEKVGVVDVLLLEESEIAAAGSPVLKLRSGEQMVVTYVSREDQKKMEQGTPVVLNIDEQTLQGTVLYIDDAADAQTHSYRVEIGLTEGSVANGSVGDIDFIVGQFTGTWIPIQSVQTSTIDFVYLVNDGRAVKRTIHILEVKGDEALVEGVERGEHLVVSGMKSLIEGMLVKSVE